MLHLRRCRPHVAVGVLALRRVVDARAREDAELHAVGAVALRGVGVWEVRQRPRARIIAVDLRTEGLRQASRAVSDTNAALTWLVLHIEPAATCEKACSVLGGACPACGCISQFPGRSG